MTVARQSSSGLHVEVRLTSHEADGAVVFKRKVIVFDRLARFFFDQHRRARWLTTPQLMRRAVRLHHDTVIRS